MDTCHRSVKYTGRTIALIAIVLPLLLSCKRNKGVSQTDAVSDRDTSALMVTSGITSLISENGVPKYRMKTEKWEMYDKADPPHWSFEYGVYLEVLDSVSEVSSLIMADTAYYYEVSQEWELRSNVHAENVEGEQFDTDLLFWDQLREIVYSDSKISIKQKKQTIYGRGFESNQDFTRYTIRHTDGIFPADDVEEESENDS